MTRRWIIETDDAGTIGSFRYVELTDTPPPPPPPAEKPTIQFTASRTSIQRGETITLEWSTQHATSATLNTVQVPLHGSSTPSPAQTVTYTLAAIGPGGESSKAITVTVTSVPDPPPDFPPATKEVRVDPTNLDGIKTSHQPGTHVILAPGNYDLKTLNFGGRIQGTPDRPIVYRSEGAVFRQTGHGTLTWMSGHDVILSGLTWEKVTDRHINLNSNQNQGVSRNIEFRDCKFFRSTQQSVVAQGDEIRFRRCHWEDNCQVNRDGLQGVWPYTTGTWWYWWGDEKRFSGRVEYVDCSCVDNWGEGIHPSYSMDAHVERCVCHENLYIDIYLNNTGKAIVRNCTIKPTKAKLTRYNEPPRAISASVEEYSKFPEQPNGNGPILLEGNVVDGGSFKGCRMGFRWAKHRGTDAHNRYHDVTIRNNTFRNCKEALVIIDKMPSAATSSGNAIDMPIDGKLVQIGDPQYWVESR